jgi:hypothetical protein
VAASADRFWDMPAKSIIPRKDLIRVAHLLAAGVTQKRSAEELGWASPARRKQVYYT